MIFLSGTVMGDGNDPEWKLHEGHGEASYTKRILFKQPFSQAPLVTAGVAGFDGMDGGARFYVGIDAIDAEGFNLALKTWGGARVWSITVNWLAIGQ